MKIIDLSQGSADWLAWRKTGIGASDACDLVGHAPWNDPEELRKVKLGLSPGKFLNERMARGQRLEPEARALFNVLTGLDMSPVCVIHDRYEWMKASLDGITPDHTAILEVKCMGVDKHWRAVHKRKVPDYYMPQMQHQLMVCDRAKLCYFLAYHPDFSGLERAAIIPVYPNEKMQRELLVKETEFWSSLKIPPTTSPWLSGDRALPAV